MKLINLLKVYPVGFRKNSFGAKSYKLKANPGFVLLVVFLVVFLLLLLTIYFFSFVTTELKISKNQAIAEQTYYLAEAGVEEAIWKLKFDETWQTNFENSNNWSATFTRDPVFFDGGAYTIQIQNSDYAKGEIIATGTYTLYPSNKTAQRIVKIKVFKALNPNPVEQIAMFAGDGNIIFNGSAVNFYNGGIFANGDINLTWFSDIYTSETASTTDDIYIDWLSSLDADGSEPQCSGSNWTACENWPPIGMPMIDFDSSATNSYKYKAQYNYNPPQVYTQQEFTDLLKNNPNLTINGITYVTGQVKIKRGQHLTVNGVLVADGSVTVGIGWQDPFGTADLFVNNTQGQPSGVLTKGSFKNSQFGGKIDIDGLIYASDQVDISSLPQVFTVNGGIITRQVKLTSIWQVLNITYNNDIIMNALAQPIYSPVVSVEHWEEEY